MKKRLCKPCVALLLTMVMIFGGVNLRSYASGVIAPYADVIPITVDISAKKTIIEVGDALQLSCYAAPAGGTKSWSTSSSSIATVSNTGLVTAVSAGTVIISAYYVFNGSVGSDSVTITVVPRSTVEGLKNAHEYYIMSSYNEELLGTETNSDADLTNVCTMPLVENIRYKWKIEMQSDGTFQFINKNSPTGKCLTMNGTRACIKTNTKSDNQKFTIQRVTAGTHEGLYTIKCQDRYLRFGGDGIVSFNLILSEKSYWSFMQVEKGYSELFCNYYPLGGGHFDTTNNFYYFREVLSSEGYNTSWSYTNNSPSAAFSCMTTRDHIFVHIGHGNAGLIAFYNASGVVTGVIAAHANVYANVGGIGSDKKNIASIQNNGLSHSRVVLYLGCNTANDYLYGARTYNLLDITFDKGASFVLGTTDVVFASDEDLWLTFFLDNVDMGFNIETCIEYANLSFKETKIYEQEQNPNTDPNVEICEELPILYRGDVKQYLTIPNT